MIIQPKRAFNFKMKALTLFLALISCDREENFKKSATICPKTEKPIFVSGSDVKYQNSALMCMNQENGAYNYVHQSNSGDTLLKLFDNHLLFHFDRSKKSLGVSAFNL